MLPTIGDLLGLDVIRRGSPRVVAGSGGLDARVRWVHVLELADVAHLLQGGELVLTTGVALPAELCAAGLATPLTWLRGSEPASAWRSSWAAGTSGPCLRPWSAPRPTAG